MRRPRANDGLPPARRPLPTPTTRTHAHTRARTHAPRAGRETFCSETFKRAAKVSPSLSVSLYLSFGFIQPDKPLIHFGLQLHGSPSVCACVWILNYKKSDSINKRVESALDAVKLSATLDDKRTGRCHEEPAGP